MVKVILYKSKQFSLINIEKHLDEPIEKTIQNELNTHDKIYFKSKNINVYAFYTPVVNECRLIPFKINEYNFFVSFYGAVGFMIGAEVNNKFIAYEHDYMYDNDELLRDILFDFKVYLNEIYIIRYSVNMLRKGSLSMKDIDSNVQFYINYLLYLQSILYIDLKLIAIDLVTDITHEKGLRYFYYFLRICKQYYLVDRQYAEAV